MAVDLRELYFGAATQYYIVGRYAVFSGLNPVAGNLLHHAVEMALKGHLASKLSATDLKNDYKHSLCKLWRTFKKSLPTAVLSKHDAVIAQLDQFETIRYPEHIVKHGMCVLQDVTQRRSQSKTKLPQPVPRYDLCLKDVDTLLEAIFASSSVNTKFFVMGLNTIARKYLVENNTTSFAGQ
mgnify:CR=1 FL=1